MRVAEVTIELADPRRDNDRLRAYAHIVIDDALAIRDIRIIDGERGLFVAMPSRKITDRCPACRGKNHLAARFCADCGSRLAADRRLVESDGSAMTTPDGRPRLHADIAFPINRDARKAIHDAVIAAYEEERDAAARTSV